MLGFYWACSADDHPITAFAEILQQKTESEPRMRQNLNSKSPPKVHTCVNLVVFLLQDLCKTLYIASQHGVLLGMLSR